MKPIDRRRFLASIGAGAALLPAIGAERANAGCLSASPKRLIIVTWPNGIFPAESDHKTWPIGSNETNFVLPNFLSPLEPFRNDLLLLNELDYTFLDETPNQVGGRNGHDTNQGLLTGRPYPGIIDPEVWRQMAAGPSVDRVVGQYLKSQGFAGLASLFLGVQVKYGAYAVWKAAGQALSPDSNPYHVFDTLFGGQAVVSDPRNSQFRMARKSLLDFVGRDLERFQKRLGAEDRQRVQSHVETVRELERALNLGAGPMTGCPLPTLGATFDVNLPANLEKTTRLQMDLMVTALATDVTRVGVLQIGDLGAAADLLQFPFLGLGGQHNIVHEGRADGRLKMATWFSEQWAYLLGKLKSEKEGSGDLLTNTAVLFIPQMADGALHDWHGVPMIMAGSCGAYFKVGRSIRTNRVSHNRVLIALANAMGVGLRNFGEIRYGEELTSLRG
jgi:Protein of unknown function (DUF1552)